MVLRNKGNFTSKRSFTKSACRGFQQVFRLWPLELKLYQTPDLVHLFHCKGPDHNIWMRLQKRNLNNILDEVTTSFTKIVGAKRCYWLLEIFNATSDFWTVFSTDLLMGKKEKMSQHHQDDPINLPHLFVHHLVFWRLWHSHSPFQGALCQTPLLFCYNQHIFSCHPSGMRQKLLQWFHQQCRKHDKWPWDSLCTCPISG